MRMPLKIQKSFTLRDGCCTFQIKIYPINDTAIIIQENGRTVGDITINCDIQFSDEIPKDTVMDWQ